MRVHVILAANAAALLAGAPALAAPTITSAVVTGPTGTVWNTTKDSFYTLFVQKPVGNVLNPNDEAISASVGSSDDTNFAIAGDGWPTNTKVGNSDPFYTLTLTLKEGSTTKVLSGKYTPTGGLFVANTGTVRFDNVDYSLTAFAWNRTLSNVVGKFSVGSAKYKNQPIGSKSDYLGAFTVSAVTLPEPATWGMMIMGFGAVGATMRRRSAKVAFAA